MSSSPQRETEQERHARRLQEDPEYRARKEQAEQRVQEDMKRQRDEWEAGSLRSLREGRVQLLPRRIARAFIDGVSETRPLQVARRFRDDPEQWMLVLAGAPGLGKSVGAAEVMHYQREETQIIIRSGAWNEDYWHQREKAVRTAISGIFVQAMQLTRADTYGEGARAFWDEIASAEVLVIDDLGAGILDGKGYVLRNLTSLLCQRYDGFGKTVITTNLDQEGFVRSFFSSDGGRLLDRFRQGGVFYWARGTSLRVPTSRQPAAVNES